MARPLPPPPLNGLAISEGIFFAASLISTAQFLFVYDPCIGLVCLGWPRKLLKNHFLRKVKQGCIGTFPFSSAAFLGATL